MLEYLLFTYPNCLKCEELKQGEELSSMCGREYELTRKESKFKIRDFLDVIKRDKDGAIILPTLVILQNGNVAAVLNDLGELRDWLKLKE